MSKLFSASLYFLSFMPLWVSVVFTNLKSIFTAKINLYTEYISIFLIVCGLTLSLACIKSNLKNSGLEGADLFILKNCNKHKTITAEFLLSYILPLFAFDFTLWDKVILFLIFFVTLGYLCIKHNYFSANIVLELLNFSVYHCEVENTDKKVLSVNIISNNQLTLLSEDKFHAKTLNNDFYLFTK